MQGVSLKMASYKRTGVFRGELYKKAAWDCPFIVKLERSCLRRTTGSVFWGVFIDEVKGGFIYIIFNGP